MAIQEDPTLYNQITVKNIDDEDFVFKINREMYMIRAGEIRIFPKFMVRPMLKHLIDKMLIKRDKEGTLLRNQKKRDELAAQIILKEEVYEKPSTPTDRELVENMNKGEPELDRILQKNKAKLRAAETSLIPEPEVDTSKIETQSVSTDESFSFSKPVQVESSKESKSVVDIGEIDAEEHFDQIEEEKNRPIPSREEMLKYAKNVLKLDISEEKTKKAWDAMDDEKLYKELGLDKEEDLTELGFK